jgi:hypothetical protein
MASHKIYILATVHELIGICDDLEKQLRLPVSKANTTGEFLTATGSYIQCGPFSKQQLVLKQWLLEESESALAVYFKQANTPLPEGRPCTSQLIWKQTT